MNINIAAASLAAILILIFGWITFKYEDTPNIPDISRFPFNQATGKERSFVNKNGDSSLWIEGARRKVIAKTYKPNWCCGAKKIKETQHTTGSTSGVVEAYFISGFGRCCPEVCCTDIVYDGSGDGCIMDGNVNNGCDDACEEVIYDGNVDNGCADACEEVIYDGSGDGCILSGEGTDILG